MTTRRRRPRGTNVPVEADALADAVAAGIVEAAQDAVSRAQDARPLDGAEPTPPRQPAQDAQQPTNTSPRQGSASVADVPRPDRAAPTPAYAPPMRPGDGYTIPQAAAVLGCSVDTVRRRVRAGELAAGKDASGRYRVRLDGPRPTTAAPTEDAAPTAPPGGPGELASLRAHVATLTAELAARRHEAEDHAQAMAEMRRLLAQAQAMIPRLHDPADYAGDGPEPSPDGTPKRRRWWQR